MKKNILKLSVGALSLVLVSFITNPDIKQPGIDVNNFDKAVSPNENFYLFVNGNWTKNNPIPASESSWGSFREIGAANQSKLKIILDEAAANKSAAQGSNTQKIGDFYSMAMDSVKLNKEGAKPLASEFELINKVATTKDLLTEIAHLNSIGVYPIFNSGVDQDLKKSTEYITYLSQGGLGLPDRDYYTNTDERTLKIQKAYKKHIENIFKLLGDKPTTLEKTAKTIFDIETSLAKVSMTKIEQRNYQIQYNKMSMAGLAKLTPAVDWNTFFNLVGIKGIDSVIVSQPDFFKEVNKMIPTVSINDWKTYLRWNLINRTASKLSDPFVKEHFNFYGTTLVGIPTLKPRWKSSLEATDASLGEALGELFVKKYFPESSKKRVSEMVDNLIAAYRVRIDSRDWMSPETKKQANAKLDKVIKKFGYPDKFKDYTTLDIKRDSYVQNFLRANTFAFNEDIHKLGKPVDKTKWEMTPPTVNAYYNPAINEIVFPAGIMQPVFFNPDADDAVNYGSMGAIIGHELTHGFDDQGAGFDADGNLKNWWTKEDLSNFKTKTNVLVKQFNDYVAIDDMHVKGELTLGENIADLGGLTIAYYALQKSLEGKPVPAKIDGFTAEQRFFIAWTQGWRINMRPEFLKNMVQTNPHSPGIFRGNGPLSNMQEFYDAFNVKEGDKMYRPKSERAEIW
ncbi:MAG: M13 family metallopeptidase [Bacteroidia bacterium]